MPSQMLQIHAHEQVPSWFPKASIHDLVALDFEESRAHYGMFESPIFTFTSTSFLIAQLLKNPPAMQEILVRFLGRKDPLKRDRLPTPVFLGFPCSAGKESACSAGDLGLIPGLGRSLEKGKATHCSILAWRSPWTIKSMGSQTFTSLSSLPNAWCNHTTRRKLFFSDFETEPPCISCLINLPNQTGIIWTGLEKNVLKPPCGIVESLVLPTTPALAFSLLPHYFLRASH